MLLLEEIRDELLLPELLQCWLLLSRRNPSEAASLSLQAQGLAQGLLPHANVLGLSEVDMHRQAQAPANKPSAEPLPRFCWLKVGTGWMQRNLVLDPPGNMIILYKVIGWKVFPRSFGVMAKGGQTSPSASPFDLLG